ncbi:uncharacterized protein MYCFIDRAFT_34324 [Pseudocercospora fijiensis CIRAD86]|uniref:Fatty acid hydroxylase domain-containing protein n=1 Tax=Pseudocercospora fijiensis (strain CIRAD86) TaxID=383855 RepID=M2YMX1_PSEFD|nr:uncharacterized protein MYCFIDRAFT_34324 [Pseudocercospora fijiensis CIRAD86]EME79085.1 hypothetical protein MYCFIDRAFT_34324 [Pseudocercospora fijiensis CIRAD86]
MQTRPLSRCVSDEQWAILSPVITYWTVSAFYELLDYFDLCNKHRIRLRPAPPRESGKLQNQNLVTRGAVFRHVLMSQVAQTALLWAASASASASAQLPAETALQTAPAGPGPATLHGLLHGAFNMLWLLSRQFCALVVLDTWVFWTHYAEHRNTWLYRNVHAVHHQLYVPFSFGALYNHWFESLCVDGMGGILGVWVIGLSSQETIWFYALVTAKTVEDHCAYDLPWSPFSIFGKLTGADIIYHNVHHERWGLKTNFQIYFTWWDRLLGSEYRGHRSISDAAQSHEPRPLARGSQGKLD